MIRFILGSPIESRISSPMGKLASRPIRYPNDYSFLPIEDRVYLSIFSDFKSGYSHRPLG